MYEQNALDYSIRECQIRSSTISLQTVDSSGNSGSLQIVKSPNSANDTITYETQYQSDVVRKYEFGKINNRLYLTAQNASYTYSAVQRSAFPRIIGVGDGVFAFSRANDGTTIVEYKSREGMPLWQFKVQGSPMRAQPWIAALNYELIRADFVTGVPLLPYLGGAIFQ